MRQASLTMLPAREAATRSSLRVLFLRATTFKGFSIVAVLTAAYLAAFHSVTMPYLQAMVEAPVRAARRTRLPPAVRASAPPPPSAAREVAPAADIAGAGVDVEDNTTDAGGWLPAECDRLERLAASSTARLPSLRKQSNVLLLTSAYSLPPPQQPASTQPPTNTRGDVAMLLDVLAQNLANPSVAAVHLFVPGSPCARRLDAAHSRSHEQAAAAARAARANKKGAKGGGGGGGGGGGSGKERDDALLLQSLAALRVRLVVGRAGDGIPSWAVLLNHASAVDADLALGSGGGGGGSSSPYRYVAVARADVSFRSHTPCTAPRAFSGAQCTTEAAARRACRRSPSPATLAACPPTRCASTPPYSRSRARRTPRAAHPWCRTPPRGSPRPPRPSACSLGARASSGHSVALPWRRATPRTTIGRA